MKHKYVIILLSVVLVLLVVAKMYEPTHFPLQLEYYVYAPDKVQKRLSKYSDELLAFRAQQNFSDIPWDNFSLGDDLEHINNNSKYTTDSTITFNGEIIETEIVRHFSQSGSLMQIDLRIKNTSHDTREILAMFGQNYLKLYENYDKNTENSSERYFWIKGTTLVIYEIEKPSYYSGTLVISDISDFSDAELKKFIRYGHAHFDKEPISQKFLENIQSTRKYTAPTTNRYDDSTYQGSSKQKEDLEAIDKYFGF